MSLYADAMRRRVCICANGKKSLDLRNKGKVYHRHRLTTNIDIEGRSPIGVFAGYRHLFWDEGVDESFLTSSPKLLSRCAFLLIFLFILLPLIPGV